MHLLRARSRRVVLQVQSVGCLLSYLSYGSRRSLIQQRSILDEIGNARREAMIDESHAPTVLHEGMFF